MVLRGHPVGRHVRECRVAGLRSMISRSEPLNATGSTCRDRVGGYTRAAFFTSSVIFFSTAGVTSVKA